MLTSIALVSLNLNHCHNFSIKQCFINYYIKTMFLYTNYTLDVKKEHKSQTVESKLAFLEANRHLLNILIFFVSF